MRNSPEEEVLLQAMNAAFTVAFCAAPVTFIIALVWRPARELTELPSPAPAPMRWGSVVVAAAFWCAIAIYPQRQVANTVALEKLIAQAQHRAALDYYSAHRPKDFAPGRVLPPNPFEYPIFEELPACFAAIQPGDAAWVRTLLVRRLDEMCSHYDSPWRRRRNMVPKPVPEQLNDIQNGVNRYGPEPGALLSLIDGLHRIPEGRAWLKTNAIFIEGLRQIAKNPPAPQRIEWLAVSNRLASLAPAGLQSNSTAAPLP
jgi:hypothetical protein